MQLNIAKILFWSISYWAIASDGAQTPQIESNLGCGFYRVEGILKENSVGDIVIRVRDKTSSPFELILLGGNIEEKLKRLNTVVVVDFYVPYPIKNNDRPFVFFQSFVSTNKMKRIHLYPRLIKPAPCGDKTLYRSSD